MLLKAVSVEKYHVNLISRQDIGCTVTSPLVQLLFSCLCYSGTIFTLMCLGPTVEFLNFHQLLATFHVKLLPDLELTLSQSLI